MRIPRSGCIAACVLSFVSTAADAQSSYRLEERLPENTAFFISVPDVAAAGRACRELGIVQLLREPECQAFLRPLVESVPKLLSGMDPMARELLGKVMRVAGWIEGEAAFALVDIPQGGMTPPPSLALALDFRGNVQEFRGMLDEFLGMLREHGATITTMTVEGVEVQELRVEGFPIYHGFVEETWVACTDSDLMKALVGPRSGESLADSAELASVRGHVAPQGGRLFAYLNVDFLWSRLEDRVPDDVERVIEALGLHAIRAAGYGVEFEGGDVVERIHVSAPGERRGVLALLDLPALQHRMLDEVPVDALLYESIAGDPGELFRKVLEIVNDVDPQVHARVTEGIAQVQDQLGFRIDEDLLDTIGPELGYYLAMPAEGGLFPEIVVFLQLRDAERFRRSSEKLIEFLARLAEPKGASVGTMEHEHRGVTYHTLEVSTPGRPGVLPLRPAIWIRPDVAVVTLVPHTMKAVIERSSSREGFASLREDPHFHKVFDSVPPEHFAFGWVNARRLALAAYNTLVPIAQMFGHGRVLQELPFQIELADLPSAATVAKHLGNLSGWGTSDEQGLTYAYRSPTGVVPLVVAALGLTGWTSLGRISEARAMSQPVRPITEPAPVAEGGGVVRLRASYWGDAAEPKTIDVSGDPWYREKHPEGIRISELTVGEGGALAEVVVFLQGRSGQPLGGGMSPLRTITCEGALFSPRVQAVQRGEELVCMNEEETMHNFHFKSEKNPMRNVAVPSGRTETLRFSEVETPIELVCDIHPWQRAHLYVVDSPWFTLTGEDGLAEISHVSPGSYRLVAMHPKLGKKTFDVDVRENSQISIAATFE